MTNQVINSGVLPNNLKYKFNNSLSKVEYNQDHQ